NRLLAYVVTDNARARPAADEQALLYSGVAWYGLAADIWVTDLETNSSRNLTAGKGNSWAPSWSPDGRYLAFLGDLTGGPKVGPARLWAWKRASGKLRQVSGADVREGFVGLQWAGDEHSALVAIFPEDLGRDGYAARMAGRSQGGMAANAAGNATVSAQVFEFDPASVTSGPKTDQVNLDLWRMDLGLINLESGSLRRLTRDARIGAYAASPDRRRVAYTVLEGAERPGSGQYLYQIVVQDLTTRKTHIVASNV